MANLHCPTHQNLLNIIWTISCEMLENISRDASWQISIRVGLWLCTTIRISKGKKQRILAKGEGKYCKSPHLFCNSAVWLEAAYINWQEVGVQLYGVRLSHSISCKKHKGRCKVTGSVIRNRGYRVIFKKLNIFKQK